MRGIFFTYIMVEFLVIALKRNGYYVHYNEKRHLYFISPPHRRKSFKNIIYEPLKDEFIVYATSTPFEYGKMYRYYEVLEILRENGSFDYKISRCLLCKGKVPKSKDKNIYIKYMLKTQTAGVVEKILPICSHCFAEGKHLPAFKRKRANGVTTYHEIEKIPQ